MEVYKLTGEEVVIDFKNDWKRPRLTSFFRNTNSVELPMDEKITNQIFAT